MAKVIWKYLLWKHLFEVAQIVFQGNRLTKPEEMITLKRAETG